MENLLSDEYKTVSFNKVTSHKSCYDSNVISYDNIKRLCYERCLLALDSNGERFLRQGTVHGKQTFCHFII